MPATIRRIAPALVCAFLLIAGEAAAQGMAVGFGGLRQDPSAPVEVSADEFRIDQGAGSAVFSGNVVVVQGALRMAAERIVVEYGAGGGGISRLHGSGGVTMVTAEDAAEAAEAVYEVASGRLVMTGAVLLTQGGATIAGERLVADLRAGTGQMEGRVRTVFQPRATGN